MNKLLTALLSVARVDDDVIFIAERGFYCTISHHALLSVAILAQRMSCIVL